MVNDNKSILVVDDSPTVRRLVELIMSQQGYEVYTAENGNEGIKIAVDKKPSIILVDFLMPKMNGYQFCKKIRSDGDLKAVPIILITAKGEEVGHTFEEKFGVIEYFQKPFEPDELVEKVNEVIGKKVVPYGTDQVPSSPDAALTLTTLEDTIEKIIKKYFKYEMQVLLKNLLIDTMKEMEIVKKENLVFSGDLTHISMPDVLQFVDHAKLTGKLSVLSPSFYSEVYIENGLVVFATLSKKGYHKFVTDLIMEDGRITKKELAKLLVESKERKLPIGRILVQKGFISEDELMNYLKDLTEDAFYIMIEADSGNFYFESSPLPLHLSDVKFRILLPGLILDALRRLDEKKVAAQQFNDDSLILARLISNVDEIENIELDSRELAVFSQIDGRKTLREIIDYCGLDELEVKRICYSLQKIGLLKIKDKSRSRVWQEYL